MTGDPLESETLLRAMFGAEGHLWSVGTLSAFMTPDGTGTPGYGPSGLILGGARSRTRLRPGARLLAFETLSSDPRGWNHGIALSLPGAAGAASGRVRRARDYDPIDPADAGRPVLDLGLGQGPVRALFRPATGEALATEGLTWEEAAPVLAALPGEWVIDTPVLRLERAGAPPHCVPQARATGRSHAETTPLPPGLIPVAHVFPPHPARQQPGEPVGFDSTCHARFQAILARHGRPDLWALKAEVVAQLAAGRFEPPATDRHAATVVRVALRQHAHLHGPPPRAWTERFDRPLARALEGGG
ncbi:DUF6925 family protein [Pseudogemmobacter humi]|uniref:Uncharacterized protein n=1 Tax=Pseudogemmobacter humi TaxID=2483812 RepID=A0A3P5X5S2_9RHOB|nr:hypothetical protein [Pseudogemmobacter humi]VDC26391.1 hypothetical protein XINFAN_01630 [Pseudogemmobacter humi]